MTYRGTAGTRLNVNALCYHGSGRMTRFQHFVLLTVHKRSLKVKKCHQNQLFQHLFSYPKVYYGSGKITSDTIDQDWWAIIRTGQDSVWGHSSWSVEIHPKVPIPWGQKTSETIIQNRWPRSVVLVPEAIRPDLVKILYQIWGQKLLQFTSKSGQSTSKTPNQARCPRTSEHRSGQISCHTTIKSVIHVEAIFPPFAWSFCSIWAGGSV